MQEIIKMVAIAFAGLVGGSIPPIVIIKVVLKRLVKRVDEVTPSNEYVELKKDIVFIKKEILEMRGKTNEK